MQNIKNSRFIVHIISKLEKSNYLDPSEEIYDAIKKFKSCLIIDFDYIFNFPFHFDQELVVDFIFKNE